MEIFVSQAEGKVPVTVLKLKGDLADEDTLRTSAKSAYDAGARNILLDLKDVPYITSSGLRAIHYTFDLFREDSPAESDSEIRRGIVMGTYKSSHLKLLKPTKNAMKSLSLAGYDMFLEIHSNYSEAIASFG